MLVQFGNNWIQKIPLTAKLDSAYGLVQFWLSSEFFSSNYFQIGQHVVLLHIHIVDLFAALNELASASARTLLKLASSVCALLKPYGDILAARARAIHTRHN